MQTGKDIGCAASSGEARRAVSPCQGHWFLEVSFSESFILLIFAWSNRSTSTECDSITLLSFSSIFPKMLMTLHQANVVQPYDYLASISVASPIFDASPARCLGNQFPP